MDRIKQIYDLVGEQLNENNEKKDTSMNGELSYKLIKCLAVVVYSTLTDKGIEIFINELPSIFEDQIISLKQTHKLLHEETEGGLH